MSAYECQSRRRGPRDSHFSWYRVEQASEPMSRSCEVRSVSSATRAFVRISHGVRGLTRRLERRVGSGRD